MLWLSIAFSSGAAEQPGGWTGRFEGCHKADEVMTRGPMHLGVRFSTSNRALAEQFRRAMTFWASVLDMDWHEEGSRDCAIQVVDGSADLFQRAVVARAQLPGTPTFQGGIAFNAASNWSARELFTTAVHEIGHVMGLPHSGSASSMMYFLSLDGQTCLDSADLRAAAIRHKLRNNVGPVACTPESPTLSPSGPRAVQEANPDRGSRSSDSRRPSPPARGPVAPR
jgi:hypothetical protein